MYNTFRGQKTFDTVARHLLTQKRRSINDRYRCQYRGDNGTKCAVGCLIPDADYVPDMEGQGVYSPAVKRVLSKQGFDPEVAYLLQHLHDWNHASLWPEALRECAIDQGLNPEILDGL